MKKEFTFAPLNDHQMNVIANMHVGEFFISEADIKTTKEVLKLEGLDVEELRAVRNSVVKFLGDLSHEARAINDYESYDRFWTNMSGITAVIDDMMFHMGGLY